MAPNHMVDTWIILSVCVSMSIGFDFGFAREIIAGPVCRISGLFYSSYILKHKWTRTHLQTTLQESDTLSNFMQIQTKLMLDIIFDTDRAEERDRDINVVTAFLTRTPNSHPVHCYQLGARPLPKDWPQETSPAQHSSNNSKKVQPHY